ncbi:Pre-mRNA-splicing factor SPF27 [Podospora didyma]|uniref:Pre-mRNA-splicing factor SPF27 n=1 Tax=Podospora didyma TaxID=330526 RepID=A0AAE0NBY7_9PEZI|nr:Pre-mRNA-splicing factor SPF27 [Podospora didyma]
MPSITTVHESLPYVDAEPTPSERSAAESLIAQERASSGPDDTFHALLTPLKPSQFLTPLLENELARASNGTKLAALDLSRYESLDPPELDSLSAAEAQAALTTALERAYTSHGYIGSRRAHLALLDSFGKNAWLAGNWHLEGELKAIERELAETKRVIDVVTLQRRGTQDAAGPELKTLEETWRRGVSRTLETETAAENLRRETVDLRRQRARDLAE